MFDYDDRSCDACGSPDAWFLVYKGQIRNGAHGQSKYGEIVECDICGVRRLKSQYALDRSSYESGAYRELLGQSPLVVDAQNLHMAENMQHVEVIGDMTGLTMVDIGCGSGCLLNYYNLPFDKTKERRCKWIDGIEPDDRYREQLKYVFRGVKKSIDDYQGKVDLALLLNVIEHVDEPLQLLKQTASITSGGVLICTPECNFKKLDTEQGLREHFYRTQHTWYFDEYSLRQCIKRAGLRYIKTVRINDSHIYIWAEVK